MVSFPEENGSFGICTGFVIDAPKGWAITAAHCITDDKSGMLVDGLPSEVLKLDDQFAILTFPKMSKPPLDIAKHMPAYGEEVISFGYWAGIFTVLPRSVAAFSGGDIALAGPLSRGMSGGPVVDYTNKVVGLNQASNPIDGAGVVCGPDELNTFIKDAEKNIKVQP